jgi:aryl-alcohol dehydrogenase-like predicted oxidoreductase
MEYREFGNTGIRVSEIGVGCGGLGGESKQGLEPVVERALELGINFFDTCDTYAETRSEQTLGRVFKNHRRDEFVVCTKFGGLIDEQGDWHRDISIPHLHQAFEASCRRLNVEHFDMYLVHTPPVDICQQQDLFAELDKMIDAGKIGCYGVSCERGQIAIDVCEASNAAAMEIAFSLFHQDPRVAFLDYAREHGVGIAAKSPMANGALTDSLCPDDATGSNKYFKRYGAERFARRAQLFQEAREILAAGGRTLAQGALAWLLTFPGLSTTLPGISSVARLEETAAASGMRLSDEEMAALDAIDGGALANSIVA